MWSIDFGFAEISFVIIPKVFSFVKHILSIFPENFGDTVLEVNNMGFLRKTMFFLLGGTGYIGVELLWRGRSHISMFAAGGLCFLLLGRLTHTRLSPAVRCILGSGIITGVEMLTGLLVNRTYHIWDYRTMPLNFMGQICLPFSLLWIPLSLGAMVLYRQAERLTARSFPHHAP